MRFFAELKRRKVLQTAVLYVATSWLLLQVAELLLDMFEVPEWGLKLVFTLLVIGFPLALLLAWQLRITPQGVQREFEPDSAADSAPRPAMPAQPLHPAHPVSAHSIAVLPFASLSEDKSDEFFAEGLSEEFLNLLSRIAGLSVVARTSSFSFKGRAASAATIASELNVAYLLDGSVRRSGNRLRITAQLIRASDSTHAWSRSFDRDLDDIFAVQDEIAGAVVDELEMRVLGVRAPKARAADPRAYALYLEGRHFFDLYSSAGYEQAVTALSAALAIDPEFAPAWSMLGTLYWGGANNSLIEYDEGARKAREASARAVAIDPDSAEALSLLSVLDVIENRDVAAGQRGIERALAIEPHNQRVLTRAGIVARRRGQLDEAIRYAEQALRSDPLSPNAHAALGFCYYLADRLAEAEAMRRRVLALSPGWLSGQYYLGRILLARDDLDRALGAMHAETSRVWQLTGYALVYHTLGRREESDAALHELERLEPSSMAYQFGEIHAHRGELDAAFEWLDRAVARRDSGLTDARSDPLLRSLHPDARWPALLARAGLA
jgi:TolB-like protein/Tfp pilus assembly protein PilF